MSNIRYNPKQHKTGLSGPEGCCARHIVWLQAMSMWGWLSFSVETVPPFLRDSTWANASPHCPLLLVDSVDGLLTECAVFSGTWAYAVSLLLSHSQMQLEVTWTCRTRNTVSISWFVFMFWEVSFLDFWECPLYLRRLFVWVDSDSVSEFWAVPFELFISCVYFPEVSVCLLNAHLQGRRTLYITLSSNVWCFIVHPIVLRFILNEMREIIFSPSFIHYNVLAKQLTSLVLSRGCWLRMKHWDITIWIEFLSSWFHLCNRIRAQ